jgi:hypothetical protein
MAETVGKRQAGGNRRRDPPGMRGRFALPADVRPLLSARCLLTGVC